MIHPLAGSPVAADDLDWSWEAGPPVSGRGIDVLMAACGRAAVLPHLASLSVTTLRWRLEAARG